MEALWSAQPHVRAPLLYRGKVRELFDLGAHMLLVATDRISAHDVVLQPAIPNKGRHLHRMSMYWFSRTAHIVQNHVVHADMRRLGDALVDGDALTDRAMVVHKTERIPIECVVRGYVTGGGWRQYVRTGGINGIALPQGLQCNARLPEPLFTPAIKHDTGHDEDVTFEHVCARIGTERAQQLRSVGIALYAYAHAELEQRGLILADCKFEFGIVGDALMLIDEVLTPDCARLWPSDQYVLGADIDSLDKEPVRAYIAQTAWNEDGTPPHLPEHVVEATRERYAQADQWVCGDKGGTMHAVDGAHSRECQTKRS
ncbi:MAG: phosphoribosylaminoimidazolesuccinocarboxamide synthase [Paenibacillaceae bacterium]|nr:phosphoribosylaminoimidazolesuccinocarboxamide synthase [Paenibacillaceae bacterium]